MAVGILLPPAGMKKFIIFRRIITNWQPAYIEPVDTLGASDAFLTGFLLSILQSGMAEPDKESVLRAMRQGGNRRRRYLGGAFGFGKPFAQWVTSSM